MATSPALIIAALIHASWAAAAVILGCRHMLDVCTTCVPNVFGLSGVCGARVQNVFAFRLETVFLLCFGGLGPRAGGAPRALV